MRNSHKHLSEPNARTMILRSSESQDIISAMSRRGAVLLALIAWLLLPRSPFGNNCVDQVREIPPVQVVFRDRNTFSPI